MLTAGLVLYHQTFGEISKLLESILSSDVEKLYIVDNGNDPVLMQEVKRHHPAVEYILPGRNCGFGAGHNIAMKLALASGCRFHAVINPDISFEAGTLESIVRFMTETPAVGLVMPRTLNSDGSIQHNCKLLPTPLDLFARRFLPEKWTRKRMFRFTMQNKDFSKVLDVPYLCGCFMVISAEALDQCGLFDERFFMYPEDIDLTRRIHRVFRTVYYPGATVIHAHGAASRKSFKMLLIHIVNILKYFNKYGYVFDAERRRVNRAAMQTGEME